MRSRAELMVKGWGNASWFLSLIFSLYNLKTPNTEVVSKTQRTR